MRCLPSSAFIASNDSKARRVGPAATNGLLIWSEFDVGQASGQASLNENKCFFANLTSWKLIPLQMQSL